MLLVDRELQARAQQLGINTNRINPASVDLTLGGHIIAFRNNAPHGDLLDAAWLNQINGKALTDDEAQHLQEQLLRNVDRREYQLNPGEAFLFQPGAFYLAHSLETIQMPRDYAALLTLKSTTGRRGLEHLNAGWIDPGFSGQITLEFAPELPVLVRVGDPLVQLTFLQCSAPPAADYSQTGRYQGQQGATAPRLKST